MGKQVRKGYTSTTLSSKNPYDRQQGKTEPLSLTGSSLCRNWALRISCRSMGLAPKSSMYFKLTPVCFFSAQPKISSTTSRGTESASRATAGLAERTRLATREAILESFGAAAAAMRLRRRDYLRLRARRLSPYLQPGNMWPQQGLRIGGGNTGHALAQRHSSPHRHCTKTANTPAKVCGYPSQTSLSRQLPHRASRSAHHALKEKLCW